MNKKLSKIITGALFSLSFIGLVSNGAYAMDKSKVNWSNFNDLTTDEMMDFFDYSQDEKEEQKAQYTDEELRSLLYDIYTLFYTREYTDDSVPEAPKDGDELKLKVGFTCRNEGYYYCKDDNLIKVNGWQLIDGGWYHFTDYKLDTSWFNDNGTWYYLGTGYEQMYKGLGQMRTGWLNDGGYWYYLQSNGAMATGWVKEGSDWYYFYSNGAMAHDTIIDGYYLNSNGAWVK